jgi:hypothetical protein
MRCTARCTFLWGTHVPHHPGRWGRHAPRFTSNRSMRLCCWRDSRMERAFIRLHLLLCCCRAWTFPVWTPDPSPDPCLNRLRIHRMLEHITPGEHAAPASVGSDKYTYPLAKIRFGGSECLRVAQRGRTAGRGMRCCVPRHQGLQPYNPHAVWHNLHILTVNGSNSDLNRAEKNRSIRNDQKF